MPQLSVALLPYRNNLAAFAEPTLFTGLRIHYDKRTGWNVEELSLWQRISYIVSSFFYGTTLQTQNKIAIRNNFTGDTDSEINACFFRQIGFTKSFLRTPSPLPFSDIPAPITLRPPVPSSIKPSVRDIPNSNKVNCWLNATLVTLFQLNLFVDAIHKPLVPTLAETTEDFTKRQKVQIAVQNLHKQYSNPRSSGASLERHANALKEALCFYRPGAFQGTSHEEKLRTQQCTSTAIEALTSALLPNLSYSVHIELLERASSVSLQEELRISLLELTFWNVLTFAIRNLLVTVKTISQRENELDEEFVARQVAFSTLGELRTLFEQHAQNHEIKTSLQNLLTAFKTSFPDHNQKDYTSLIKDTFAGNDYNDVASYPDIANDVENLLLSSAPIPSSRPVLFLTRSRISSIDHQTVLKPRAGETETPLELDLQALSIDGTDTGRYRLVGVINHIGTRQTSGHFHATLNIDNKAILVDEGVAEVDAFSSFHATAIYELITL